MGVVVPVWQVLDVLCVGAAARGLLENFPAVVVRTDPILGVELFHLVVPPRIHRRWVGVAPHPVPRRATVFRGGETPNTFGHGVHNVGVNVAALVEPCKGQFQRVQVGYVVRIIERTEHDFALDVRYLEEVGLGGAHVLPTHPRREPIEEGFDGRVLQLPRSLTNNRRTGLADALLVGRLHRSAAHNLKR